jgi:hypothetical protein
VIANRKFIPRPWATADFFFGFHRLKIISSASAHLTHFLSRP